ncbi:sensor histidine kinase [Pseudooceanicola algae]|uniref:histidine kinase n=1 Tax=Pseudooceanicola algae TaxID=1537215 RepID=A0A418SFG5_9RHOB|nr:ATP-binding protein [Pseudooceanicola algae]QPM89176.1 Adaptive-response sensory-kinase SasA [Pseudooceanicola algae]
MRHWRPSLRHLGIIWAGTAFLSGAMAGALWFGSRTAWEAHLGRAYVAGVTLYDSLARGTAPPDGVTLTPVPASQQSRARDGAFAAIDGMPSPAFVAQVSIRDASLEDLGGVVLRLAILSGDLQYEVANLVPGAGRTAPEKLGHITRLLANYCSHPVLFAQMGDAPWQRIDGAPIWGCEAQPRDTRLLGLVLAMLALAAIYTRLTDSASRFETFAETLGSRRRLGGPQAYAAEGPAELDAIVQAVNSYLEAERDQLSRRALVLSGVSHDLGTPATRLRLRAALIADADLREKFDTDIDRMTGMIEGVLTYTRSELSHEEPRQISLTSLVESVVDDYQDMGRPVELVTPEPRVMESAANVFMARRRATTLPEPKRLLVTARPIALRRALENLIDNALKYGRRARVDLTADSSFACITVEDEGTEQRAEELEALIQPFRRGPNAGAVDGFGLGLTIVTAVAEQHGGGLSFANGRHGLRAMLEICRT